MLFNEPKLLKSDFVVALVRRWQSFSALQRAEIAEMGLDDKYNAYIGGFSALQRAEIAEMCWRMLRSCTACGVSVLFNEPKLLKCAQPATTQDT